MTLVVWTPGWQKEATKAKRKAEEKVDYDCTVWEKSLTACTQHRSADSTPPFRLQVCYVYWVRQMGQQLVSWYETWCMFKLNLFSSLSCGGSPQTLTDSIPNSIFYCSVLFHQNKLMLEPKWFAEWERPGGKSGHKSLRILSVTRSIWGLQT